MPNSQATLGQTALTMLPPPSWCAESWELAYKAAYDKSKKIEKFEPLFSLVDHPSYFSLQDIRPAAITTKLRQRQADAYDFATHANPAMTHKHYDRRQEKRASATE